MVFNKSTHLAIRGAGGSKTLRKIRYFVGKKGVLKEIKINEFFSKKLFKIVDK